MKKNIFIIFFLFSFFIIYSYSFASQIDGSSNSVLIINPDYATNDNNNPIYKFIEFVNVSYNKDNRYLLYIDGWTTKFLTKETEDNFVPDKELNSGFFKYHMEKYPISLQSGRFYVNEGIARMEQIDGFLQELNFKNNYKLDLYQGIPTEIEQDTRQDDSIFGGRASKSWGDNAEIGLSYLEEKNKSSIFRKELGFDLHYGFHTDAYIYGQLDYNLETERIITHDYIINLFLTEYLTLTEEYKKDNFKHIFPSASTGAFDHLINEESEKWKTFMDINATGDYSLVIDYQTFTFKLKKAVYYYGGELRYRMLTQNNYGFAFHRMDAGQDQNSFYELREFFRIDNSDHILSFDAMQTLYSKSVYGRSQAYQFVLSAGQRFAKNFALIGSLEYNLNSFYKEDFSGVIRLNYDF